MGPTDNPKEQVLQAARWLCNKGFFGSERGSGGNVSVAASDRQTLAITPSGLPYTDMTVEDICMLDMQQRQLEGSRPPSMETGMHIGIYQQRMDVNAVVHTHQMFASVLAIINRPIPALFDEITAEIGPSVEIIPYAVSGSRQLARNVKSQLDNGCFCYIIQNHGALNLGRDMETALKNAELLEKVAQIYYYALCTGRKISQLPEDAVQYWADNRMDAT
jgi:L-ribulose-5-phosphate 4-epimerase